MKIDRIINVNDRIKGFEVTRITHVGELAADLIEMSHEKTGLRLVWLRRDEENKTFAITFETLPWNDTGVFHILEHSVLCGSDRYPVKEPFVELLKNSLNTFLNALTFSDKTMYPVSSKNDADFINLMSVYLDAVFHPAIYSKPEIFHQEGWHFDKDEDGNYSYKGVVFNEMKGAFADSEELLENAINRALFPDNAYGYCSGGDPAAIPNLTYEEFIDAHRRFYSPTNGIIYLDGDLDIDKVLGVIEGDFLASLERTEPIDALELQAAVDGGSQCVSYELSPEEDIADKNIIAWASVISTFEEREKQIAMGVLTDVLAGNNEAYIPRLILDRGLAQDVSFQVIDGIMQPWAKLEIKNCRKNDISEIRRLVFAELERLCNEGIERERIEAALSNNEFLMNERDFGSYPQGLFLGFQVMESMLYGGKPEQNLEVGEYFRKLWAGIEDGYFENLLRDVLLDNEHRCEVILEPSYSLGEERRADEARRTKEAIERLSEEEIGRIEDELGVLHAWQASGDSEEALASLPHLELSDIDEKPEDISLEVKSLDGVTLLRHRLETGDIRHITLYFDAFGLDEEELRLLTFVNSLLGDLETSNSSAEDILLKTDKLMGRLNTSIKIRSIKNSPDIDRIQFEVSFSALEHNLMDACELTKDILLNTRFTNGDMVYNLLKQARQDMSQSIIMGGHALANIRVGAMYSASGAAKDVVGGLSIYQWLKNLENNWNAEQVAKRCSEMLDRVIRSDRLTVSITAGDSFSSTSEDELVSYFASAFAKSCASNPDGERGDYSISKREIIREGIIIPADISFAVRGGDISKYGEEYGSGLRLATRILSLAFLWNEVRVKGGAYGAGMRIDRTGLLSCYSYRDPNGANSLETYTKAAEFLRDMASNPKADLTGFIVGAVADASPLMTARVKGLVSDALYFSDISYEERCEGRRALLEMSLETLASYADAIEQSIKEGGVCIVGSENQIRAAGEMDQIITL